MKVFFLHVFVLLFFCRIFSRHLFREGIANLIHANQCHTLVSHHTNKLSTHFKGTSIFHSIWFQLTLKRYQNRISIDTYVRTYTRQHAYIDAYALLLTPPPPPHTHTHTPTRHVHTILMCLVTAIAVRSLIWSCLHCHHAEYCPLPWHILPVCGTALRGYATADALYSSGNEEL